MIQLTHNAIIAAQLDHFANPPTHAKLVRSHKINIEGDEPELTSVAPDLQKKIEGTYVFGSLNGQTGEFVRMPRTPIITVLLHTTGAAFASDTVVMAPFIPNPDATPDVNAASQANYMERRADMLRRNRAALAAQHIINAGVAPNPSQPWMPLNVPAKRAWHFTDQDFDAAASIHDPRLEGTIV